MPERRIRRVRRPSNREADRAYGKEYRRRRRVKLMVYTLLGNCSIQILNTEYLNPEEVDTLKAIVRQVNREALNYYPISKVVHSKIRRYNHLHPRRGGTSLWEMLTFSIRRSIFARPTLSYENSIRLSDIEDFLREWQIRNPSPVIWERLDTHLDTETL